MFFLPRKHTALGLSFFLLFFLLPTMNAQELSDLAKLIPAPDFDRLMRNSGYIFSGTVVSVECLAASAGNGVPIMRITFRVQKPIRGVRRGEFLAIREWAGLWESGERYRPGDRILLFLYPASKLGLTSPVGGPLGRFQLDSRGNVVVNNSGLTRASSEQRLSAQSLGKHTVTGGDSAEPVRPAGLE